MSILGNKFQSGQSIRRRENHTSALKGVGVAADRGEINSLQNGRSSRAGCFSI
jgi:hypothetical protein